MKLTPHERVPDPEGAPRMMRAPQRAGARAQSTHGERIAQADLCFRKEAAWAATGRRVGTACPRCITVYGGGLAGGWPSTEARLRPLFLSEELAAETPRRRNGKDGPAAPVLSGASGGTSSTSEPRTS